MIFPQSHPCIQNKRKLLKKATPMRYLASTIMISQSQARQEVNVVSTLAVLVSIPCLSHHRKRLGNTDLHPRPLRRMLVKKASEMPDNPSLHRQTPEKSLYLYTNECWIPLPTRSIPEKKNCKRKTPREMKMPSITRCKSSESDRRAVQNCRSTFTPVPPSST